MEKIIDAYTELAQIMVINHNFQGTVAITLPTGFFDDHLFALEKKFKGSLKKAEASGAKNISDIKWFESQVVPGVKFIFHRYEPKVPRAPEDFPK